MNTARARQAFNTARFGVGHFIATHPVAAAICATVALCVVVGLWQVGGGVVSGIRSAVTSAQVTATEGQAHAAEAQAAQTTTDANNTAVERRVNDEIRAQTIAPEIVRTARVAAQANERVTRARASYEAAQTNSLRGDVDDHVLHVRNCADLRSLYPDERFARCER